MKTLNASCLWMFSVIATGLLGSACNAPAGGGGGSTTWIMQSSTCNGAPIMSGAVTTDLVINGASASVIGTLADGCIITASATATYPDSATIAMAPPTTPSTCGSACSGAEVKDSCTTVSGGTSETGVISNNGNTLTFTGPSPCNGGNGGATEVDTFTKQ